MSKTRNKGTTKVAGSRTSAKRTPARSGAARAEGDGTLAAQGRVRITKTVKKGADVWRIERPEGVEISVASARVKRTIRASAKRFHRALASLATK